MQITEGFGSSSPFVCNTSVPEADVASYEWVEAWADAGAGNSPAANFGTPADRQTSITKGHWFASPNKNFQQGSQHWRSEYNISCKVTVGGLAVESEPVKLTVEVPNPMGETNDPILEGIPTVNFDASTGLWSFTDIGVLSRTPAQEVIRVSSNGDFYFKTLVHEDSHVQDWSVEPTYSTLLDPQRVWQAISAATATSHATLLQMLDVAIGDEINRSYTIISEDIDGLYCAGERRAYVKSNAVAPHFLEFDPNNLSAFGTSYSLCP